MLHCFNEDTIYTKFIKSLLLNSNIPTVQVWKPGNYTVAGMTYITKDYIVKAIKSYTPAIAANRSLTSVTDTEFFKIIEPYIEGNSYNNITTNFISNTNNYDADTHKYLGEYLRALRDLHNLDLMPYYNCVNNLEYKNLRILNVDGLTKVVSDNKIDDGLKTIVVPIKFNQDYTIYINSNIPVNIAAIFFDGFNNLTDYTSNIFQYNYMSFSKPIKFRLNQTEQLNYRHIFYKNYLSMIIQIPITCKHIVVLEGDYTENKLITTNLTNEITQVCFGSKVDELSDADINKYCKVIPSLTRSTENKLYAFSDRLIEFLTLNVISHTDDISKNIERVQNYASSYNCLEKNLVNYKFSFTKGIWSNSLRVFLYDLVVRNKKFVDKVTDISGYVDKDTEIVLTRGQDV